MGLMIIDKKKQVQRNFYTRPDGYDGPHTWDVFYRGTTQRELVRTPYSMKAFGNWIHIAKPEDVVPFNPKGYGLKSYKNTVSGSFSYSGKPISIMISNGVTIRDYSCHCWEKRKDGTNSPESVLWYNRNGTYGVSQVTKDVHLPDRKNILWAIGGAGIKGDLFQDSWSKLWIPSDAKTEYFYEKFGDVWRKTSHIAIGIDKFGYFIAVEMASMNFVQGKALLEKLGLTDNVIWLDGGHVTASNNDGHSLNTTTPQYNSIKLGGE